MIQNVLFLTRHQNMNSIGLCFLLAAGQKKKNPQTLPRIRAINGYSKYQFLMELLGDLRNLSLSVWLVPFKYH